MPTPHFTLRLQVLAAAFAGASHFAMTDARAAPRLEAPDTYLTGSPLAITASGLQPRTIVRVSALRHLSRWDKNESGDWVLVPVTLQSWAEFRVPRSGVVSLGSRPLRGTWRRAEARDLLWSGERVTHTGEIAPENVVRLRVASGAQTLAQRDITLTASAPGLVRAMVAEPGLNGAYAAPPGPGPFPVLVTLHGSEGGDIPSSATQAARFASRGYATLSVNYFAWPYRGIVGVPTEHIETPIEIVARARTWLASRLEADVERFGVYGISKGAEFTALAAARYDWIDAAVACVASDVVWEGYGRTLKRGEAFSSWSFKGAPLPFIRLPQPDPEGKRWRTNTERYDEGRATSTIRDDAAIPIENARARVLLIGADRDEVWASGRMSRALAARMQRARRTQVDTLVFTKSGHQICGDGAYPGKVYQTQGKEDWAKDLRAEGEDQITAWDRTLAFLENTLRPAREPSP